MFKLLRFISVPWLTTANLTLVIVLFILFQYLTVTTPAVTQATFWISVAIAVLSFLSFVVWLICRRMTPIINASHLEKSLTINHLTDTQQLYDTLLNCLDEAVLISNDHGEILSVNTAAEKILGYPAAKIVKKMRLETLFGEQCNKNNTLDIIRQKTLINNTPRNIEITTKCVELSDSQIYVTTVRDITKFSSIEADLTRHKEHLEDLVKQRTVDLARTRDHALEASRAKSDFLTNMSHELRTPLNAIIGYSEMISEEAKDAQHHQYLEDLNRIHISGKHLLDLINDVLDLSKIESGKMELLLDQFTLRNVLDEVVVSLEPQLCKNQNKLELSYAEDLGELNADQIKVKQIFLNLLSNSAKFTENGTITVQAYRFKRYDTDWIHISVSDTGIGMTKEQTMRLFKEFYQGDSTTTRKYGGTGLGLAISRRFCEMMGGEIHISSEIGKGSTFTVTLPAAIIGPKTDPKKIRLAPSSDGYYKRRTKVSRVLVVDDDPFSCDLLERFLTREGFHADIACDGETGLLMARKEHPDVIILDVKMPDMDGWSVLSQLKKEAKLRDIPVIMLTMTDNRELSLALGASDFLSKPIEKQRLVDILCNHLRKSTCQDNNKPHILVIEDDLLSQDLLRKSLTQEGVNVAVANNGLEGLEQVKQQQPSMIFLDLMMPEMDGFQFLEELRKNEDWVKIPIVILTAIDLTKDQQQLLQGQVEVILDKKSLGPAELLHKLHELVVCFVRQPNTKK